MAKKIIWSAKAQDDRKRIFTYWNKRNKSTRYSIKLNKLFEDAVIILADYPKIGKRTNKQNVRIKIARDYLIYFKELDEEIYILTIFSSHRNPANLKF
ncbi:MAG: type II toxin-antitoxin system RelE/ParE family toxin [Ginsengibacter sp.]